MASIVEDAPLFPGACVISGAQEGPFFDLQTEDDFGQRRYVRVQTIVELAEQVGCLGPVAADALAEQLEAAEARLAELEGVLGELHELRRAVRRTLRAGAVVDRQAGEESYRLRGEPGQRVPELA